MAAHRRPAVLLTALDVETRALLSHLKRKGEDAIDGTVFYLGNFEDWFIAVAECGADFLNRIEQRRQQLGFSERRAAVNAGLSPSQIRTMRRQLREGRQRGYPFVRLPVWLGLCKPPQSG